MSYNMYTVPGLSNPEDIAGYLRISLKDIAGYPRMSYNMHTVPGLSNSKDIAGYSVMSQDVL